MKKLLLSSVFSLSSLAFAGPYDIDSAHASANFAVKHLAVSTVHGTLGTVTGTASIDDKDITKSTFEASIAVKDLNTKEAKRDEHLRGPDFFEVEKFPVVTFKSTKVAKGKGKGIKVTGDLTIKGVTKSVTIDAELTPEVTNPFSKAKTRGFTGTTAINRKDFGLAWNFALETGGVLVGDEVKISLDGELIAKAEPAAK